MRDMLADWALRRARTAVDPETRGMLRDEAIAWLWIWAAVVVLACAALLDGGGP